MGAAVGLFFFSLLVLGIFIHQAAGDWLDRIRPARSYACGRGCCWRCRQPGQAVQARCPRCRAHTDRVSGTVECCTVGLAVVANVSFGRYLRHRISGVGQGILDVVTPTNVVIRQGDELALVFDWRGNMRALENYSLGTAWRLPCRVSGGRSPLAAVGLIMLAPAILALLVVAPFFFLARSILTTAAAVATVTGTHATSSTVLGGTSAQTGTTLGYLVLVVLASVLVLQVRSRPRLNKRLRHSRGTVG